jgi:hypothetical protein
MTKRTKTAKKPAYVAYYVPDRENAFWTKVGAMWEHEDGQGFSLSLELMPVGEGRLVLRKYEDKQEQPGEGNDGKGA